MVKLQDEARLRPREKGLNDPHLGTIDRNFKCATCEENMIECPGHFGVIKLAVPVYHYGEASQLFRFLCAYTQPGFLGKVKKLLEIVCHNCGKIKALDVSYAHACKTLLHRVDACLDSLRTCDMQSLFATARSALISSGVLVKSRMFVRLTASKTKMTRMQRKRVAR